MTAATTLPETEKTHPRGCGPNRTGKFGKPSLFELLKPDRTGLTIALEVAGDFVRIDFNQPTTWVTITPQLARGIAANLLNMANAIEMDGG
jgi:hypothetical protein